MELARAGRAFVLFEASDGVGGRVRTDLREGFRLDRGFQVLLTSYRHIARYVDPAELSPRYFESGALLRFRESFLPLRHPGFHLSQAAEALLSPALPFADKVRMGLLVAGAVSATDRSLLAGTRRAEDRSVRALLEAEGFSRVAVEHFFRPFFGGVLLDNELESSAALFLYDLKKFVTGRAWLPAAGIGAFPEAMARKLPEGSVRLGTRVLGLDRSDGRVVAVQLPGGLRVAVEGVVVALDEPSRVTLLGGERRPTRSVAVVYLRSPRSLYEGRLLVLTPGPDPVVRHFVQLTNVVPEAAPPGVHLISATVLEPAGKGDLVEAAVREIRSLFPGAELEHVATVMVPQALPVQGPGFGAASPPVAFAPNGWLAGDGADGASVEAALASGRRAAEAFL